MRDVRHQRKQLLRQLGQASDFCCTIPQARLGSIRWHHRRAADVTVLTNCDGSRHADSIRLVKMNRRIAALTPIGLRLLPPRNFRILCEAMTS